MVLVFRLQAKVFGFSFLSRDSKNIFLNWHSTFVAVFWTFSIKFLCFLKFGYQIRLQSSRCDGMTDLYLLLQISTLMLRKHFCQACDSIGFFNLGNEMLVKV